MYFRKRVAAVALLILLSAAAVWGSTREMSEAGEVNIADTLFGGSKRKETIYFWYTDDEMTSFYNSAAVAFGERRGVRVIPVLTSDSGYLESINAASLQGEHIPDAYVIGHDSLEKAYLAGLASALKDRRNVCCEENFSKAALDAVTYHGKPVAYPLNFVTSVLVYNETYLETWAEQQAQKRLNGESSASEDGTPGEDEEESEESAEEEEEPLPEGTPEEQLEALKQRYLEKAIPNTVVDILKIADTFDTPEGVEGVMKWDVSGISYNYWIVGNYMNVGGDTGDDEYDIKIYNDETIQCLETYKGLNQFFSFDSSSISYDSVMEDFIKGKMIFTVGTTDVIRRLEEAKADGSFEYEYGLAVMPDVSSKLSSRSLSVTDTVVVNGYTQHAELANDFAAYLVTECSRELYEKTGKIAAYTQADMDKPLVQVFKQEYADSVSLPKLMSTGNFWLQLEVLFSKVWNGGDIDLLVKQLSWQIAAQTTGN